MQSEKKHANKEKPGRIKARILIELINAMNNKTGPVPKDDLKERLGLTKENLRFHLHDPVSGLCPGIVTERQRKLYLKFRNVSAIERAIEYLATDDRFRKTIELWFADVCMSVYGDFFNIEAKDMTQLSEEMHNQYVDFFKRYEAGMGHKKRIALNDKDIELVKELSRLRRGDKGPGFMFIYSVLGYNACWRSMKITPDKLILNSLRLGKAPNLTIYSLAAGMANTRPGHFENILADFIKGMHYGEVSSLRAGVDNIYTFPAFPSISDIERFIYRYIVAIENILLVTSLKDLQEIESPLEELLMSAHRPYTNGSEQFMRLNTKTGDFDIVDSREAQADPIQKKTQENKG